MELGTHNVKVLSHHFEEKDSGAACCVIKCQFDNGETDYGRIWMAKKTGEIMDKNVDTVRKIFGWTTDNPLDLNACSDANLVVSVTVEMDKTENGREVPRISWVNLPRKVMDEASANAMASRWKSKFASSATVLSVKPLSAVVAAPVEAAPAEAAPAATQEKKADPGAKTLAKFNEVFADRTQEVRNLLWNSLLNGVIPGVDTATATRDQWLAVYNALPALRKQVEEQDKALDEVPF